MAVARARHVDPRVLLWLERALTKAGASKPARELGRARRRPGRSFELSAGETRDVAQMDLPPATRRVIDRMIVELDAAEAAEAERDARVRAVVDRAQARMRRLEPSGA